MPSPDFSQLKSPLLTSGLQQRDNALYQVINTLLTFLSQFQNQSNTIINGGSGGGGLATRTYITVANELATLPNSRRELAGERISFDDSALGIRTANVDDFVTVDAIINDDLVTNGDPVNPELVFAGGDVIWTTRVETQLVFAGGEPVTVPVP